MFSASLVKDINPATAGDANPQNFVVSGAELYFTADDGIHGVQLWKTDGTQAGTTAVPSLLPGSSYVVPADLTDLNGTLYFFAKGPADNAYQEDLWRSDGTPAGTTDVGTFYQPYDLTNVGGTLYFAAYGSSDLDAYSIFKSDGTTGGTTQLGGFIGGSGPNLITNVNGSAYFFFGSQLWKTDGTQGGTVEVADIGGLAQKTLGVHGNLFFTENDSLWVSDGTAAGTYDVRDFASAPGGLGDLNGALYFGAMDATIGSGLWTSDGTAAGTQLVEAIATPDANALPHDFTLLNGKLYFAATDSAHGQELWVTDGTGAGTVLVDDINYGSADGIANRYTDGSIAAFSGKLYLDASYGYTGFQLFQSDGTRLGTGELDQIRPTTSGSSIPDDAVTIDGITYFSADDSVHGQELWRTDGTPAGTSMVADLVPGPGGSNPIGLTNVDGTLYFAADDSSGQLDLWKSDGTAAGTTVVVHGFNGSDLTASDGKLYYIGNVGAPAGYLGTGSILWMGLYVTDGTAAGTTLLQALDTGTPDSTTFALTKFGGNLYYTAVDPASGEQLWERDASGGNATVVQTFGGMPTHGEQFVSLGGNMYFVANTGTNGFGIWETDGISGDHLVWDVGNNDVEPVSLYAFDGSLFFAFASTDWNAHFPPRNGVEEINGATGAATYLSDAPAVSNFTAAGSELYFDSGGQYGVGTLYATDGTPAGTHVVDPGLRMTTVYPYFGKPGDMLAGDGVLYFIATNASEQTQLWQTDGTTTTLADPSEPTAGWTAGSLLSLADGQLLFTATDATHGDELWDLPVAPAGQVLDGGFENTRVGNGFYGAFNYDPVSPVWQFTGTAGLSGGGSGFTALNPAAPDGTQVAFLQDANATISQSLALTAGNYTINFDAAQRVQWQNGLEDFEVLVEGSVVGTYKPAGGGAYATFQTAPFTVAAGNHTIEFLGLDSSGGDNTAFIDNVQIAAVPTQPSFADAGFESPSVGSGSYGSFAYDPNGTPWTFSGAAGISGNGSGFTALNPNAPEGTQVAFLQGANASISQTLAIPDGEFAVSFDAAQRVQWQNGLQDFEVLVNGIRLGTLTPAAGGTYASYQIGGAFSGPPASLQSRSGRSIHRAATTRRSSMTYRSSRATRSTAGSSRRRWAPGPMARSPTTRPAPPGRSPAAPVSAATAAGSRHSIPTPLRARKLPSFSRWVPRSAKP